MLSDQTVKVLDRVTTKGTRSRFIDRAILRFVEVEGMQSLREQLKTGYSANAERDLETAIAWFPFEVEAARTLEPLAHKKPRKRA